MATMSKKVWTVRYNLPRKMADKDPRMTQRDLVRATGLHQRVINYMFNNKYKQVKFSNLEKVAAALDCDPLELLSQEEILEEEASES